MANAKRKRRLYSVSDELVAKSREAALAAVQIFNNPQITFKAEIFIVLMTIGWTYLLHGYYRKKGIEYRYFDKIKNRRKFHKTAKGAFKYWELERCLNERRSPVDADMANNLRFLIGIRHEIEHQMTSKIDASFSAKFQACCLNYNDLVKKLFGEAAGIDRHLAFSLQFSSVSKNQVDLLSARPELPANIEAFVKDFESTLTEDQYNSQKFAYRVFFVAKTANRKGQADEVIEFVKPDSEIAKSANISYAMIRETERPKYLPSKIVAIMQEEGFIGFKTHLHTEFWQAQDAKNLAKGFGVQVEKTWYWYENWLERVREHCKENFAV